MSAQNLADCLAQSFDSPLESCEERAGLDTFLVYNHRRKVGVAEVGGAGALERAWKAEVHMPELQASPPSRMSVPPWCLPSSRFTWPLLTLSTNSLASHIHSRQVTSSAKRKLKPGSTRISQTPNGSFYDLQARGGVQRRLACEPNG